MPEMLSGYNTQPGPKPLSQRTLNILTIDDNPHDAELLRQYLLEVPGLELNYLVAENAERGNELRRAHPELDLIFLDYEVGADSGLEILKGFRDEGEERPIAVLTGHGSEKIAALMMRSGADDNLIKNDATMESVLSAVDMALDRFRAKTNRSRMEAQLVRLASTDELTSLDNRRRFIQKLRVECLRARRHKVHLSILLLDIDHFKRINDTYGHMVGDQVLRTVGAILNADCRATDFAGRYGGEEFVVALPLTDLAGASVIAERIRENVAAHSFFLESQPAFHVTCSIGVANVNCSANEAFSLMDAADKLLYVAKQQGRNRVVSANQESEIQATR
ncbi:hypothetical protein BH09SUM1_BH09SUM1_25230 [soil metagenome]